MIYFIRYLNRVTFRLVYNGLSWFGYRCFLVMMTILFWYFMKGIKYTPLCLIWGFSNYVNYSSTVYFGDTNCRGYYFLRIWSRPRILISANLYGFHMDFKVFYFKIWLPLEKNRETSIFINKPKFYQIVNISFWC